MTALANAVGRGTQKINLKWDKNATFITIITLGIRARPSYGGI